VQSLPQRFAPSGEASTAAAPAANGQRSEGKISSERSRIIAEFSVLLIVMGPYFELHRAGFAATLYRHGATIREQA
jgi:hypothetical protein